MKRLTKKFLLIHIDPPISINSIKSTNLELSIMDLERINVEISSIKRKRGIIPKNEYHKTLENYEELPCLF